MNLNFLLLVNPHLLGNRATPLSEHDLAKVAQRMHLRRDLENPKILQVAWMPLNKAYDYSMVNPDGESLHEVRDRIITTVSEPVWLIIKGI